MENGNRRSCCDGPLVERRVEARRARSWSIAMRVRTALRGLSRRQTVSSTNSALMDHPFGSNAWAIAAGVRRGEEAGVEFSAVRGRAGVIARAIRNRPEGSGISRRNSVNRLPGWAVDLRVSRRLAAEGQSRSTSQPHGSRRHRGRTCPRGLRFSLPLRQVASRPLLSWSATGNVVSALVDAAAGRRHICRGMNNYTLVVCSACRPAPSAWHLLTSGDRSGSGRRVPWAVSRMVIGFFSFCYALLSASAFHPRMVFLFCLVQNRRLPAN